MSDDRRASIDTLILSTAIQLLEKHEWVQAPHVNMDENRYCAEWALRKAERETGRSHKGARLKLVQVIGTYSIPSWNDTPGRTKDEVISAMKDAINL